MKKTMEVLLGVLLLSIAVYWWNLDNKLLFYVVRPALNRHYDSHQSDGRL